MSTLPTSDLRSDAKCDRRVRTYNAKWKRGARTAPGMTCWHGLSCGGVPTAPPCPQCAARPYSAPSKVASRSDKRWDRSVALKAKRALSHSVLGTTVSGASDTSDDEVADPSAAPDSEIEIMYSYDARNGPAARDNVLSNAVVQAVKKFENKQTEQLVKKEYDMVYDGKDAEDHVGDFDDEFELVDHAHLA